MYQVTLSQPHALGLEKLTGSNRGLYYANEQVEQVPNTNEEEGGTVPQYTYDVYEISDARFPNNVKDEVITQQFPCDREHMILRKNLAKVLKALDLYDTPEYEEFRDYNEFVESVSV